MYHKQQILDDILPRVINPAQYLGTEKNAVTKDLRQAQVTVALAFPDTYEIGMSHLGLAILYHVANRDERFAAERVFAPLEDYAQELDRAGLGLVTLESGHPVRDFDVLGFSLQHELCYTTVLWMLDLAGIPVRSVDRTADHPIVIAGGPCAFSPEPLADFVDIFFLGDAEESFAEFLALHAKLARPRDCAARRELIRQSALSIKGLYVPALYSPRYDAAGRLRAVEPVEKGAPFPVEARVVRDLERAPYPTSPVVPLAKTVHDRIMIEIMRGCARGCRFCQAGATKRPVRRRSQELIVRLAEETYSNTGHNEIALVSLSSADYPDILGLARELSGRFRDRRVNLSLPSLRVGKELCQLPSVLADVRRGSFTLAPEAAGERLRRIVNKHLSEQELEDAVMGAYNAGWRTVKLYFMIGLPGEEDEDVQRIMDMATRLSRMRPSGGPAQINATVSIFVPKALTPFQWAPMISMEEADRKRRLLTAGRRRGPVRLKFHDARQSFVEGVLARGDRRLGEALFLARAAGAKLDPWTEYFDLDLWTRVFKEIGFDAEEHATRPRDLDETLPWDHLSAGTPTSALRAEYEKALAEK